MNFLRIDNLFKSKRNIIFLTIPLLGLSEWFISDIAHISGTSFGLLFLIGGCWWIIKPSRNNFNAPKNLKGWINLCNHVLKDFERMDKKISFSTTIESKQKALDSIINRDNIQKITFVGISNKDGLSDELINILPKSNYNWYKYIPSFNKGWKIPSQILESDLILYFIDKPLKAIDLIWLQRIPDDLKCWVVLNSKNSSEIIKDIKFIQKQLPDNYFGKILTWDGEKKSLGSSLRPFKNHFNKIRKNVSSTKIRLLNKLHKEWQSELEIVRRQKLQVIQQKSQLIVAGAVFVSPVASIDLLILAILNGLMVKEMADVWSCKWSPKTIEEVSRQIAKAAIAQCAVQLTSNSLLGISKLHSGVWLISGSMQAISSAYLTRVVARSLADFMAIGNGLDQPDMEFIKNNLNKVVSEAAEKEKIGLVNLYRNIKSYIMRNDKLETIY
tara:strand:- start:3419 stop:4744 length:1326 start_codon:yes stop_codon:yes gene_type:complete